MRAAGRARRVVEKACAAVLAYNSFEKLGTDGEYDIYTFKLTPTAVADLAPTVNGQKYAEYSYDKRLGPLFRVNTAQPSTQGGICYWFSTTDEGSISLVGSLARIQLFAKNCEARRTGGIFNANYQYEIRHPIVLHQNMYNMTEDLAASTDLGKLGFRIYVAIPKGLVFAFRVDVPLLFSGVELSSIAASAPSVPAFDVLYKGTDTTFAFLRAAFDKLKRPMNVAHITDDPEWKDVLVIAYPSTRVIAVHTEPPDLISTTDLCFPERQEVAPYLIYSVSSPLQQHKYYVNDQEFFYCHGPEVHLDGMIGTLQPEDVYIRTKLLTPYNRTAAELLTNTRYEPLPVRPLALTTEDRSNILKFKQLLRAIELDDTTDSEEIHDAERYKDGDSCDDSHKSTST